MSLWHPTIIEKTTTRKVTLKLPVLKNFINFFPQFSGKHPFKCMRWANSKNRQPSRDHFFFKKLMLLMMKMVNIWISYPDSMLRVWNEGGPPWAALCEVEFLKVSHGETKTDVFGKKKKSIFAGLMHRWKHIIVSSSVPVALGTQKETASLFRNLTGCCTLCFQHPQKLIWIINKRWTNVSILFKASSQLLCQPQIIYANPKSNI